MRSKHLLHGMVMLLALAFTIFAGNLVADDFPPGDADGSQAVDIDDVVLLVEYIFNGGPPPVTPEAGDANCADGVDVDDVVYLVEFIFNGGPEPCADTTPSGSVVDYTGCKVLSTGSGMPPDQDCIEWLYDGDGFLQIKHVNEGLNCCPVIVANLIIQGNTITIEEIDSLENGGCYCLCLFDVDYEIVNLAPDEYLVTVIEPYVLPGEEPLEFTVDLRTSPSGSYCITRDFYPWGDWR